MYIQILLLLDAQQTSPPRQALQRETPPALAQVGTFRSCLPEPTVPAPLSGVAVTSQILSVFLYSFILIDFAKAVKHFRGTSRKPENLTDKEKHFFESIDADMGEKTAVFQNFFFLQKISAKTCLGCTPERKRKR